ncbi:MAG TPA: ParB/RepB/Spo0J family partition protein [Terriglobales bacterium]|nr:ParB/RepB/Spo0J family partition protein [Terriglobales bacterium]
MVNASNAAVDEKVAVGKTGADKTHEKVMEKRRALGRGLDSLLAGPRVVAASPATASSLHASMAGTAGASPSSTVVGEIRASGETASGDLIYQLPLTSIDHNPYQTRKTFAEEPLQELADSIRVQGVIQPIVVRPGEEGRYHLILGERRFRASRMAGIETIPAIVKRVSQQQAAEMTIVENLQRQDLNCLEQATAFANLSKQFLLSQEQIGERVGLSRGSVSNYMRLLELPSGVQESIWLGKLSYSHARLLARLKDHEQIWALAEKVMEQKMSVEQLEAVMMGIPKPGKDPNKGKARWVDPNVKAAQRSLEEILGMRVRIRDRQGRGKILIEYGTIEDFDRVVGMLGAKR